MGRIYWGSCPKCGYQKEFYLGGGKISLNLTLGIQGLGKEEQHKIREMERSGEIDEFSIENRLTRCEFCRELDTLQVKRMIRITSQRQQTQVFGSHCNRCHHPLQVYEPDEWKKKPIICPSCQEGQLLFESGGFWD